MITDHIKNINLYKNLSPRIGKALEILAAEDFTKKDTGKYEVDGEIIHYMVQRYTSKPIEEGKFETHKKYIDIQFVAASEEMLGYAPLNCFELETDYDGGKDVAFYKQPEVFTPVALTAGMFCILFPQDGHMPCRQLNGKACDVVKVVVKVKVEK
ncbi:MAG: YhcH/YjgK/YiaL family protein [Phycisphaerae bacterium]|nr:YhcH/YjgK/YiaL family protein [Phycisphaerae bacterium]